MAGAGRTPAPAFFWLLPDERGVASGTTHRVRRFGCAVAPMIAGFLMADASLAVPLYVGASMKMAYDLILWRAFRGVRPPEENDRGRT